MSDNPLSISTSPVNPMPPAKRDWYWPEITDLASARAAALRGA